MHRNTLKFMHRNTLKQAALAVAISAVSGLAFAQATSPAAGSETSKTDSSAKTSGKIISDQTQAPDKGTTKEGAAASQSGQGSGASTKSTGDIVDKQTKPGAGTAAAKPSGEPMKGDPSTKTSADIIKDKTEAPGATGTSGQPPRSTSSGTTGSGGTKY